MIDFVKNILFIAQAPFYWTYYPTSIFLLVYLSYLLVSKKMVFRKFFLYPIIFLSYIPTGIFVAYFVVLLIDRNSDAFLLLIYFGIGIIINIISCIFLVIYLNLQKKGNVVSGHEKSSKNEEIRPR